VKLHRMKQQLRGAFTVDAPRRRLRTWVGVPFIVGAGLAGLPLHGTAKDMVANGQPVRASLVANAIQLVIGGVLTAIPYTRWAGALTLGWSTLSTLSGFWYYGTDAGKQAMALTGAKGVGLRILKG